MEALPKTRRPIRKTQLALGLLVLAGAIFAAWYLTSGRFHEWVRARVVASLENATGGRTSIGRIDWNLSKLELVLYDVTIHGHEAASEAPFARIDRLYVRARITSLVRQELGLEYVEADHPVLHLITYPDGTTNQPTPASSGRTSALETVLNLQLQRGEVHDGILLINNDAVPFEGSAEGVAAVLTYAASQRSFHGQISVTKLDLKYHDMRPFAMSARMQFDLSQHNLAIESLLLRSGPSVLNAKGNVSNFADAHIALTFSGTLDLQQIAAITRTPGIRGGSAKVQGAASYYSGQYRATGSTEVRDAAYHAGNADVKGVNARANFTANNTGLQLTDVHGTALGGSFDGSAAMQVVLTHRGRSHRNEVEEQGRAELRFRGFDVQQLERAMPRQRELQAAVRGTASGSITAHWAGTPDNAIAELNVNVLPPAAVRAGEVPLTASIQATYNAAMGSFSVHQLQLSMPDSRVQATGALGAKGAALHVALSTSNFSEFKSALADLGIDFTIPAEVHGSLTFTGDVSGTKDDPRISGHVVANDFDYLAEFTAAALLKAGQQAVVPAPPTRIHWDRLTADLQYSSHSVALRNAQLQAGAARDSLTGSASLVDGHIVPSSRLDLQATVANEDTQRIAALVGTPIPFAGQVTGTARIAGAAENPIGSGTVQVTKIPAGREFATASGAFSLRDHQLQFANIEISRGPAHVSGLATFNLTSHAISFDLHGAGIDLATVPELQSSRVSLGGKLSFTAHGEGQPDAPSLSGRLHVAGLVVNGESLGDLNAQADTQGRLMQVSASTTAQTAQLALHGTVRLEGDFPVQLTVDFPHVDFDPLLRAYLQGRLTGHSMAEGTAQVTGPLRHPELLNVDASVQQFSAAIEKLNLRNVSPVHFRIAKEVLTLDNFHIAGPNTDFAGSGSIPLAPGRSMDLSAHGTMDLTLIQAMDANFTSAGKVTVNVRAQGAPAHPLLTGNVEVQNGSIAYIDLPNGLSEVNGTFLFDQNRLVIDKLTGQSGGGAITFGGYVAYANGLSFSLSAHAQDMRLRYPPGISAITNVELRWAGTPKASTLSGDLTLTRFNISPQFDFATYIATASQPLPAVSPASALSNVRLDVHVVSTPALQVSTSLAKVSGDIDLRIRGTLTNPSVLGRVNILRGTVFFNGTTYQLQRGDITFVNPTTIEPVLNLEFTTRIAGYDINLSLDGPVDRLHTTYRSDPPLPSTDIISLLAFRQCPTSAEFTCSPSAVEQAENYSPTANPSFSETASNQILGEALNATLSNRVQRLFGISRVKISPEIATAIGNPSARITVEQQVSNNVTITYVTDVAQASQQVIQVEYNVNRNLSIVAVRDQFGVLSFDVRIRRRKR